MQQSRQGGSAPSSGKRQGVWHPRHGDAKVAMPHTASCTEQRATAFLPPRPSSCHAGAKSRRKWFFIQPDTSQMKCPGLHKLSALLRSLTGSSDPLPGTRVVLFQPKSDFNKTQSFSQPRARHISCNGCDHWDTEGRSPPGSFKEAAILHGFYSAFQQFL